MVDFLNIWMGLGIGSSFEHSKVCHLPAQGETLGLQHLALVWALKVRHRLGIMSHFQRSGFCVTLSPKVLTWAGRCRTFRVLKLPKKQHIQNQKNPPNS